MRLTTLTPGTKGFDCNTVLTRATADRMRAVGYDFAVRYVRRTTVHDYDITAGEVSTIMDSGLALMLVQHVASPTWAPDSDLGRRYGATAAAEAALAGYMVGAHVWCDLEGVAPHVPRANTIGFCNEWHDIVNEAGYRPGLYVGDSCGLDADTLYRALRFDSYWAAYNLNHENYPAVRNVMLRQRPYPPPALRAMGVQFEYDEDFVQADKKGGLPCAVRA